MNYLKTTVNLLFPELNLDTDTHDDEEPKVVFF